ncbi:MAG: LLM class flavin-dependent oxidoreductase [Pseudomonadota bacterium]
MRFAQLLSTGTVKPHDTCRPLQDAVTCTQAAERLGWDEVWTTEHQFNPYVTNPCALTLASYLLGQTERVTIGTGVVVLPNTHPVRLASQAAVLQALSGGRLRLGLGRGSQTLETRLFSDLEQWQNGFPQAVADVKRLLDTGQVDEGVPLVPAPAPTPMVVAATSEASVVAAAAAGVPFLIAFPFPDAVKSKLLDTYATTAERQGHTEPAEHWLSIVVHVADSHEQGRRDLLEHYIPWNRQATAAAQYLEPRKPSSPQQEEQLVDLQAFGRPADIAARLHELMQLSKTQNLLIVADTTLDAERTQENMARIMQEVRPLL